jgi:hypothetical protein
MASNLPTANTNSTIDTKQFFDKFFANEVTFPTNEIDASVGFFLKRGFDTESSRSISIVLLNQARLDNVNAFELLDTLKSISDVKLSQIIAQILNSYREKISLLGYRIAPIADSYESRNILV